MSENVHPMSFLITNTDDVVKQAQDSQEPVMLTVGGQVKIVVQDVLGYQKTQDQLAMLRILALGHKQTAEGKVPDNDDFVAQLNAAPAEGALRRLGFMSGQITVPDDFDRMGSNEIEQLFNSNS